MVCMGVFVYGVVCYFVFFLMFCYFIVWLGGFLILRFVDGDFFGVIW